MTTKTPLLDQIGSPADLKGRSKADLKQIADELRAETIDAVSVTGGHLGAGLGVVELTVAMHAVFDTPNDKIVWDVGHQVYPHKIITGRRDRIRTLPGRRAFRLHQARRERVRPIRRSACGYVGFSCERLCRLA